LTDADKQAIKNVIEDVQNTVQQQLRNREIGIMNEAW